MAYVFSNRLMILRNFARGNPISQKQKYSHLTSIIFCRTRKWKKYFSCVALTMHASKICLIDNFRRLTFIFCVCTASITSNSCTSRLLSERSLSFHKWQFSALSLCLQNSRMHSNFDILLLFKRAIPVLIFHDFLSWLSFN